MDNLLTISKELYGVAEYNHCPVNEHHGGRNNVYILSKDGAERYVLRFSTLADRTFCDYLAETEYIRYLHDGGASVADVIFSINGNCIEKIGDCYVCMFEYAKGMLISDNGYRYRDNAPLKEYFYNTGKTLGKIHSLSKKYVPVYQRQTFFDKYNIQYICRLIPDGFEGLKEAIAERLQCAALLTKNSDTFGLVHFDFSDGNYHIDMQTGKITVFDFDNCIYCFYMYDLANLWLHGTGWFEHIKDADLRAKQMQEYFDMILQGYCSQTDLSQTMLEQLPLFIDMVLIENIIDEFESAAREGLSVGDCDIDDEARCLINNVKYAGFFE